MTLIRGGLIGSIGGVGGSSSSSQLALSDGLACYAQSFSGVTTFSVGHNLGTEDVVVEFRDATGNLLLPLNWQVINSNVLDVEFSGPTQGRVVIIGCIESGLAPVTGGVTLVEGLSGIIDLDSPNGSINISTTGQTINLNAIFTPASGALLAQHSRDLITLSGLINAGGGGGGGVTQLQGISGVITLDSPNDSIAINVNGQTIELNGIYTWASGQLVDSLPRRVSKTFTPTSGTQFVLEHGLRSQDFVFTMWKTDENPMRIVIPVNVYPSGLNHAVVSLDVGMSGKVVFVG